MPARHPAVTAGVLAGRKALRKNHLGGHVVVVFSGGSSQTLYVTDYKKLLSFPAVIRLVCTYGIEPGRIEKIAEAFDGNGRAETWVTARRRKPGEPATCRRTWKRVVRVLKK